MNEELKIGVFVCECGNEISGFIDIGKLISEVNEDSRVIVARKLLYGCSEEGLEEIKNEIKNQNLNRLILAGCTPRTHEPIFQKVCEEVGLNRFLFEMVNIRDQCSWVHTGMKKEATEKAITLLKMGIARVSLLEPRESIPIDITPVALIIGGGIAGMTAALELAKHGVLVKLVEKEVELGGMLRNLYKLYPSMSNASELISAKIKLIKESQNIQVFTKAKISAISGHVGDYRVIVEDDRGKHNLRVGAIILATGANIFEPKGMFGYGEEKNVITQLELEYMLYRALQFKNIKSVVMLQCVGARDGEYPYCSRVCCMTAIKNAILLRENYPEIEVSILFRDLQTANVLSQDDMKRARVLGVRFYKYNSYRPPKLSNGKMSFYDELSSQNNNIPYDLLVLSTPLIAPPDAKAFADMLKIPIDEVGFFPDTQVKLKPFQFVDNGICSCGNAHFPATVVESMYQASVVAARVGRKLSTPRIESNTLIAAVDEKFCRRCENCIEVCSFGAITMKNESTLWQGYLQSLKSDTEKEVYRQLSGIGSDGKGTATVDPFLCRGCGACTVVCPTGAMRLQHYTNQQFFTQIDATMAPSDTSNGQRILGFCCIWGGYAAADIAGAKRIQYPTNLKIIRVDCSARVAPTFILRAFEVGADGVLIVGCPIGECHYQNGNERCQKQIEQMRPILSLLGIEPERLRVEWIGPDEGERFAQLVNDFYARLKELGPAHGKCRSDHKGGSKNSQS